MYIQIARLRATTTTKQTHIIINKMKQIFILTLFLFALTALENNRVITQEDLQRIRTYLENYQERYIGDSLFILSSLEQIPGSDVPELKQKYCVQLSTFWEKNLECECQQLNLAALTLKCEDKRRADLNFSILKLHELAYIARTLTSESVPESLKEAIENQNLECEYQDETPILLAKMQLLKVIKKDSEEREKCIQIIEKQQSLKINSKAYIENLIEVHGNFILANEETVANKQIMKQHSGLVFKARKYLTERQFHKYRPRLMYAILRSAFIMRNYERLIVPQEIKLEKGSEKTLTLKVVNTLNEVLKENYKVKLSILEDEREVHSTSATYDEGTSRYVIIIPGDFEIGDYTLKWTFSVPKYYTYSLKTSLIVMYGRLEIVRLEYDDGGSHFQEVGRSELATSHIHVKESVGERGRVGLIMAGLQSIVPRYLALNLYRGSELKYTILGTVSRDEELVSFYFPKYFEEEVAQETKYEMELVAGDRWIYNCPLYQKLGSITLPGSKMQPAPLIPSKYQPKELFYFEYGQSREEPPALAVYGMIAVILGLVLYFWLLARPLRLNCEKWSAAPSKSMHLGFVLCLASIMGTMIAFFLGLKLIPTLQLLALLGKREKVEPQHYQQSSSFLRRFLDTKSSTTEC